MDKGNTVDKGGTVDKSTTGDKGGIVDMDVCALLCQAFCEIMNRCHQVTMVVIT